MVIIGLQCGHDAAVTVLVDGQIRLHLERERVSRVRHVYAVSPELILTALDVCGLEVTDIDYFALCTTQGAGYWTTDNTRLDFEYDWQVAERIGAGKFNRRQFDTAVERDQDYKKHQRAADEQQIKTYNCESPLFPGPWIDRRGMAVIDDIAADKAKALTGDPGVSATLVQPMSVTLLGRRYPAVAVKHQLSHAAAAFFQSPFEAAPILSHDNGSCRRDHGRYPGGMLFFGDGNQLIPIWTAPILAGLNYARSAEMIDLGTMAGPGKLMGLSAYGEPDLFAPEFVGDGWGLSHMFAAPDGEARWKEVGGFFEHLAGLAAEKGYDTSQTGFSDYGKVVAASAQKQFVETTRYVLDRLDVLLGKLERTGDVLCFSGGCALNCPANSAVVEETHFSDLFVPPSCDDGGLSTGAALYVHHHVFDRPRSVVGNSGANIALLGSQISSADIDAALRQRRSDLEIQEVGDPGRAVATDLVADRVVAFFQGRAECGPRALGSRSLLADPRQAGNWPRVNDIKRREQWRPFAPACLSERLREHFAGGPEHSPHMLFNYRVKGEGIPAVTHVDGTARTQTLAPGSGGFRSVVEEFDKLTGVPVVLNTSFNGPGEPIVETVEDALRFFDGGGADVLYLENRRVVRQGLEDGSTGSR